MMAVAACVAVAGGRLAAEDIDPWLLAAAQPWHKITTIRCAIEETRGSHIPAPGGKVEVSRAVTWLWSAKPDAGLLAIVGGPRPVPGEAERKNAAYMRYYGNEYDRNWCTRTMAYGNGRFSSLEDVRGLLRIRAWQEAQLDWLSCDFIEVVPLYPFDFLKRSSADFEAIGVLPEQLRNAGWLKRKWADFEFKPKSTTPARHVIAGTFPPSAGNLAREESIEVVLELDGQTHLPVIVATTEAASSENYSLTKSFTYTTHHFADGSAFPLCTGVSIPGDDRPHIAVVKTCQVDKPIAPAELVLDVSQARRVLDVDTGATLEVDAGGK